MVGRRQEASRHISGVLTHLVRLLGRWYVLLRPQHPKHLRGRGGQRTQGHGPMRGMG